MDGEWCGGGQSLCWRGSERGSQEPACALLGCSYQGQRKVVKEGGTSLKQTSVVEHLPSNEGVPESVHSTGGLRVRRKGNLLP